MTQWNSWKRNFLSFKGNLIGAETFLQLCILIPIQNLLIIFFIRYSGWFSQMCFPSCASYSSLLPHSILWDFLDNPSSVATAWISLLDQEGGEVQIAFREFWLLLYVKGPNPSFESAWQGFNHICQLLTTNLLYTQKYFYTIFADVLKRKKSDTGIEIISADEKWRFESIMSFSAATGWGKSFRFRH